MGFLIIEVLIALFVKDRFIRPYFGDFLVVIFLYCLLKGFINLSVVRAAALVLCFAYAVEWMQYLDVLGRLGWSSNKIAATILGNHFDWEDMLLYTLGICTVLLFESGFLCSSSRLYGAGSNQNY